MQLEFLTKHSPRRRIEADAGNKGRFLFELEQIGVRVPQWVIVPACSFELQCTQSGMGAILHSHLRTLDAEGADAVSMRIRSLIERTPLVEAVAELVRRACAALPPGKLAVRSSGAEEDSSEFSFAGQFDSFLGVHGESDVATCLRRCWASAYSSRSLRYRHEHGLDCSKVRIAVVLQCLIEADVSGVAFSVNPTTGNPYESVISAVYGLGEGLVSGAVDADVFVVDRFTGEPRETALGEKAERHTSTGVEPVAIEARSKAALSDEQIHAVQQQLLTVERALGAPQDVEWCFSGTQLYLLQTRPITSGAALRVDDFEIWDNSNIVENYPGVTSPLTYSMSRYLYGRVFGEYCRLLWLPRKQRQAMEEYLGSLLGQLNGRMYYNLLNWYKLVAVNPFQSLGRQMLGVQMGLSEPVDLSDLVERTEPYPTTGRWHRLMLRLLTATRFFVMALRSERYVQAFVARADEFLDEYDAIDYRSLPPEAVYRKLRAFERTFVRLWAETVVLESAIGLPYGVLRALTQRWFDDPPAWFAVGVIGDVKEVESVEPAARLEAIADHVRSDPALLRLVTSKESSELSELIATQAPNQLARLVQAYVADFGYRANNELKLEEPDLRENPSLVFDMLKATLRAGVSAAGDGKGQTNAQRLIDEQLGPLKRSVYLGVRSLVQSAIRRRERVRLRRSRAFGVMRKVFTGMGDGLCAAGMLETSKDIFLLQRNEIVGCFDASLPTAEVSSLVAARKNEWQRYQQQSDLPDRFVSRGPVAAWLKWNAQRLSSTRGPGEDSEGELRGTPCCPGIAHGKAMVVTEPGEFTGGVLVTYRTDPGWVGVFNAAQALLVERGSPLSHAAIVAREVGLPTIVKIPSLTRRVQTGMTLAVSGDEGRIQIQSGGAK